MNKNLKQVGDDLVIEIDKTMLVIDKSILALLKESPEAKVRIKVDGKKIVFELVEEGTKTIISDDEKMQKVYEELVEKHKKTLKKLAN
jgi:hypothetical protein